MKTDLGELRLIHSPNQDGRQIRIVEQPPQYRVITYGRWNNSEVFHIPLPYVLYKLNDRWAFKTIVSIMCSNVPHEERKWVSHAPFPNTYAYGRPCYGHRGRHDSSWNEAIIQNFTSYWEQGFNDDGPLAQKSLWTQIAKIGGVERKNRHQVLSVWQELSLDDIMSLKYPRSVKFETWAERDYW